MGGLSDSDQRGVCAGVPMLAHAGGQANSIPAGRRPPPPTTRASAPGPAEPAPAAAPSRQRHRCSRHAAALTRQNRLIGEITPTAAAGHPSQQWWMGLHRSPPGPRPFNRRPTTPAAPAAHPAEPWPASWKKATGTVAGHPASGCDGLSSAAGSTSDDPARLFANNAASCAATDR